MRKVVAVCPEAVAVGFALAGVETRAYTTARQGRAHLLALVRSAEAGVVLVDDAIVDALEAPARRMVEESDDPLVVPVPMARGAALEREYLEQMIRRVIGYQVRLR
ncbi:MAG: V-type ATP synthase subunit F [Armatimonadota bacterium]|nr:V-type ATP synthase subunit F [Armatimonadota bacterium]MDR7485506.1 V-type ATP synthase subunit F [Armatimonadota bacterium]MDR7533051.1 V-type ATP synthase subunit F [Armatimonadota bacterium]MDR7536777.1 V-type ATP synthase subunit F [Armatimonadota bacterium]